jgi:LacI family transcriptional regulator
MAGHVTMADVARAAGVSRMTVSRVINDKGEISSTTRQRVLEVIEQLDYRPSSIARGLATRKTTTIGLVVPDIANPFFSDLACGVADRAYSEGYNVFLCNTHENLHRELQILESLVEQRVDGLMLCSSRLPDDMLRRSLRRHSAAVLVNRRLADSDVGTVVLTDRQGAQTAAGHLLQSGHRAIGFLAGPATSYSGRQRAEGFRAALSAAGVSHNPAWVQHCSSGMEGGRETALEMLAQHPELTALFCYNDLVAVGALQACTILGRRVPDDVAIVGFDDIPLAGLVSPPLTTCRVSRVELGDRAMELLLRGIAGRTEECEEITLRPELVVRASAP